MAKTRKKFYYRYNELTDVFTLYTSSGKVITKARHLFMLEAFLEGFTSTTGGYYLEPQAPRN